MTCGGLHHKTRFNSFHREYGLDRKLNFVEKAMIT